LLFAERYYDLLRVGGRWVTIIDDGILSSDAYKEFRDKIRKWFLIRAVISLPGQRPRAGDVDARKLADEEIATVMSEFEKFQNGESKRYSIASSRIADRLDVKNCMMTAGRSVKTWKKNGFRVLPLSEVVEERIYTDEEIITKDHPENVRVLVVRYEGIAEEGEEVLPSEGTYSKLYPVHAGDIAISNIAASYGSIAVVPESLDGCVVSSEYTILKVKEGFDPISMPYPKPEMVKKVKALADEAEDAKRRAIAAIEDAREKVETSLLLRSDDASTILAAFKPPK